MTMVDLLKILNILSSYTVIRDPPALMRKSIINKPLGFSQQSGIEVSNLKAIEQPPERRQTPDAPVVEEPDDSSHCETETDVKNKNMGSLNSIASSLHNFGLDTVSIVYFYLILTKF